MSDDEIRALDSIDLFIKHATRMAKLPILAEPEYQPTAIDLLEIAQKLMISNENMARWLNSFLLFDFTPDAGGAFRKLVGEYRTTKAGPGFHDMKFRCGDIWTIYHRNIHSKLPELLPNDNAAANAVRHALDELSNADDDLVAFIYDTVIGGIDHFVDTAEDRLDQGDINGAEAARLRFKADARNLSTRLVSFAGGLADLVLAYARLADRPVTST